ncbi:hypothetical protein DDE01_11590 [Desulfovibrio desulfuricans]|nr:hypothetical protein DDE01_11590 [Desulfovibrio desulfuricans]
MPTMTAIQQEIATVLDALAEIDVQPEQQEAALAYLEDLALQEAEKTDAIGYVLRRADADVEFLKHEEARIRGRRVALENAQRRMKERLQYMMNASGLRQLKGSTTTLYIRKSEAVQIDCNPQELPPAYLDTVIDYRPRKAAIKDALKRGEHVPGAKLEQRESVAMR